MREGRYNLFMKKIILSALVLSVIISGCSLGNKNKMVVITPEAANELAGSFINENLLQPGTTATIKEVTEENGLYKVVVSLPGGADGAGQEVDSYMSKDGKKFFVNGIDIAEVQAKNQANEADPNAAPADNGAAVTKTDKPVVELFVMSFCPYGVQAEGVMAPVFDLLKDKADIKIRFIASIAGDDINNVQSLHGPVEGIEDARQLCVEKNHGKDVLWKYITNINKDCYPIYRNGDDVYKTCWQKAAKDAGITNTAKIDTCVKNEGVAMIGAEDQTAKQYGVTGSPTLVINGVKSNAARTPEGYKTAICAAFNNPPAECSETLVSADGAAAPSGGCN